MKKVFIVSVLNSLSGAEKHVVNLAKGLNGEGYDVYLLVLLNTRIKREHNEVCKAVLGELKISGVKVFIQKHDGYTDLKSLIEFCGRLREIKPDIIHSHLTYADVLVGLSSLLFKDSVRILTRHHDYSFDASIGVVKYKIIYSILDSVFRGYIFVSRFLECMNFSNEYLSMHKSKVIHLGIDEMKHNRVSCRKKLLSELALHPDTVIFVCVGRLVELKNVSYALRMFSFLPQDSNVCLVVVGDGPLRERLERESKLLGVSESARFLGQRKDVDEILAGSDVLLHLSNAESFGLVLVEAMSQSLPIVCSYKGAMPELVASGINGYVCFLDDFFVLSEVLQALAGNKVLRKRLGEGGYNCYNNRFGLGLMIDKTKTFYRKLLALEKLERKVI